MQRLGILGGTFDPPHYAHLILAQHAFDELELTKVLFVLAGEPPHKGGTRTATMHRIQMLELAIADDKRFELSRVDVDRPGPHYTIDTIRIIQAQQPDAELFFIMGGDVYRDLPNWDRPQEMFATCKLAVAVMRRPGFGSSPDLRLDMHKDTIPDLEKNALLLSSPLVEFSSTDISQRIQHKKSVRYMVPDVVIDYIATHSLYSEG